MSPQFRESWRDYRNPDEGDQEPFVRHGIDNGRGHLGRMWLATGLVERCLPVHKTAELFGHRNIKAMFGYVGRGRQTDPEIRAAFVATDRFDLNDNQADLTCTNLGRTASEQERA